MKESTFRIVLGTALIVALYYRLDMFMLALIVMMAFEAATNWRVPTLVSRLRYGKAVSGGDQRPDVCHVTVTRFKFEAERLLRVVIIAFVAPSYFMFADLLWFIPWFVAFALLGAGVSGVCPMVLLLRRLGFS